MTAASGIIFFCFGALSHQLILLNVPGSNRKSRIRHFSSPLCRRKGMMGYLSAALGSAIFLDESESNICCLSEVCHLRAKGKNNPSLTKQPSKMLLISPFDKDTFWCRCHSISCPCFVLEGQSLIYEIIFDPQRVGENISTCDSSFPSRKCCFSLFAFFNFVSIDAILDRARFWTLRTRLEQMSIIHHGEFPSTVRTNSKGMPLH